MPSIKDWPEEERPREKLLLKGESALTDAELLAIFLRTGVKGKSALDLAEDLLQHFGGLRALLQADKTQFCQAKGLGEAKFVQLRASVELIRRYLNEALQRGKPLSQPQDSIQFLRMHLRDQVHEIFCCVFLDSKNRVICIENLFFGSLNSVHIYPREVLKKALEYNAAAVILAHNHPSGNPEPSEADIQITQHLSKALALIDVRVLDHIIIGDTAVSFEQRGLL